MLYIWSKVLLLYYYYNMSKSWILLSSMECMAWTLICYIKCESLHTSQSQRKQNVFTGKNKWPPTRTKVSKAMNGEIFPTPSFKNKFNHRFMDIRELWNLKTFMYIWPPPYFSFNTCVLTHYIPRYSLEDRSFWSNYIQ